MKTKLLIIFLILLISFSISCRKKIFNPSIPNRTEFIEDPIANLSIPSKDAAVEVTPVESIYSGANQTWLIYNCYVHFFDFNGRYYLTAIDKCSYNAIAKTIEYTNTTDYHLLKIDVNDNFYMKEVKTNIAVRTTPDNSQIYRAIVKIIKGEAYTNADTVFIKDTDGKYYSSRDITTWTSVGANLPQGVSKKAATDQYRIKIKSQNGKTYTYVYASGARSFSIKRLSDRMKQLAKRLEYKFDFKEADFNNHHMFDLGLNENGSDKPDFRLNPTNYLNNNTNYVYMGSTDAVGQLWLLPVKKDGKDYLVRLLEHGGPEMYIISDLEKDRDTYKLEAEKSLSKALALVAEGGDTSLIQEACYKSISNDANYKVNNYFLDVIKNMGAKGGNPAIYASSSKPISHYVIDIVDIQ